MIYGLGAGGKRRGQSLMRRKVSFGLLRAGQLGSEPQYQIPTHPPKDGEIALWPSTNGAIPYFSVLPGSELSITEITEYKYLSRLKPCREFIYKSE